MIYYATNFLEHMIMTNPKIKKLVNNIKLKNNFYKRRSNNLILNNIISKEKNRLAKIFPKNIKILNYKK